MSRKRKKRRKAQQKEQTDPGQVELLPEMIQEEPAAEADQDAEIQDAEAQEAEGEAPVEEAAEQPPAEAGDSAEAEAGDSAEAEAGDSAEAEASDSAEAEGEAPVEEAAEQPPAEAGDSAEAEGEAPVDEPAVDTAVGDADDDDTDGDTTATGDRSKTSPPRKRKPESVGTETVSGPRPAGNQLALARDLVESGRVKDAIALYQAILSERPENLKAHNNLGVLLDELGEHPRALEHFEAALVVDPHNVEVLSNYGSALTELARYHEADEALRRAHRAAPDDLRTRLALGILAFRRGLYELAETELHSVCDRDPEHGLAFYYRGEALNRAGRYDEAVDVMLRAAELLPTDPRPVYTLGHLYDRNNQRAEADEMYRRARDLQAESSP